MKYLLLLLFIWEFLCFSLSIPSYLLPAPSSIIKSLFIDGPLIFSHSWSSISEIISGLFFAFIFSTFTVFIAIRFPFFQKFLKAFIVGLQSFPTFSLIPIFALWVGHGLSSKIIAVSLSCFFPIASSLLDGMLRVPKQYRNLVHLMGEGAKYKNILIHIYIPVALPVFMSGFRIASVHAPITVIAAEWISSSGGLGYLIMLSGGRLEMELMFACLFVLCSLSYLFYYSIQFIDKKIVFWER